MTQQEQIDILAKLVRETRDYARRLAVSMHDKFYPEVKGWHTEDDMMGILTQIDNMVTGLTRIIPPQPMTDSEKAHREKLLMRLGRKDRCTNERRDVLGYNDMKSQDGVVCGWHLLYAPRFMMTLI